MQVTFISKIVSVRPGPALRQTISNVLNGKEEGQDPPEEVEEDEEENLRLRKPVSAHKKKVFQDLCDTRFDKYFSLVNTAYVIQHAGLVQVRQGRGASAARNVFGGNNKGPNF